MFEIMVLRERDRKMLEIFTRWKIIYFIIRAKRYIIRKGETPTHIVCPPKYKKILSKSWFAKKKWKMWMSEDDYNLTLFNIEIYSENDCPKDTMYLLNMEEGIKREMEI